MKDTIVNKYTIEQLEAMEKYYPIGDFDHLFMCLIGHLYVFF